MNDFLGIRKELGSSYLFLALEGSKSSRSLVLFNGLRKKGYNVRWEEISKRNVFRSLIVLRSLVISSGCIVIVTSPSHLLVALVRLIFQSRPIFDAGWPLIDGVLTSRKEFGFIGLNALRNYFIDFIAFHNAQITLMESAEQLAYSNRTFLISKRRLRVQYTGCDETRFSESKDLESHKPRFNQVIFRGGNQSEAGIECLAKATLCYPEYFRDIQIIVLSQESIRKFQFGPSAQLITRFLSDKEIAQYYQQSILSLGQLSSNSRLTRTIPHKFYEAAYFRVPYLTASNSIMASFAQRREVALFEANSPLSLSQNIHHLVHDSDLRSELVRNMNNRFSAEFSQDKLVKQFLINVNY